MTFVQFAQLVRFYTGTNATTFPDANILLLANVSKDRFAGLIANKVGEDYFGLRLTTDLLSGQREYSLPSEMLGKIKYAEAKLDEVKWVKLYATDLAQYDKPTTEADIVAAFATRDPAIDIFDNALFIFSGDAIVNVTDGLKIWIIAFPADWTDLSLETDISDNPTTTSHGIPRQFHELIAREVSINWKSNQPRPLPLSAKEKMLEDDLRTELDNLKVVNLDEEFVPTMPSNTGYDY